VRYYGRFELEEFAGEVTAVLREVIERGMAIEVNTSGIRQAPGEAYPALETLELYRELGGSRVVLGSDSHLPEHLGVGFAEAVETVRRAGLRLV
jgi:histidinol-phosphatase (PHP family)